MSMEDFGDKRPEDQNKDKDRSRLESGQNMNRPDKNLLLGTVQFYEDILSSLNKSLIAVYNKLGKHIEVWDSSDFKSIYGITAVDFKGKVLNEVFQEFVAKELKNKIDEVFETAKSCIIRVQLEFPSGHFWFEVALSPLINNEDNVTATVGYFRDISDTVRYEKELISSEEKYRSLVEIAPEGIISTNLKGVITSVNENILKLSGFNEKEFIGKKVTKIPNLQARDIVRFQAIIESIVSEKPNSIFEFEWKNKNDSIVWCEISTSLLRKNNKINGIYIIFNDITERKLLVQNLLKSKQAYKVIIENAFEAIYVLQNDRIKFCNSQLLEMFSCSMDELLKTPFQDFVHPKDQNIAREKITRAYKEKSKHEAYSFRIIDLIGNVKWIEIKSELIDWENKPALLSFATDVTEKKLELKKEKEHLENLEFLSEKALEFVELKSDYNVFQFIGEKIKEIIGDSIILLFSYDLFANITKTEHIECPEDQIENLLNIINDSPDQLNHKLNHELIKNLSFGKLIKYNDGIFELGYNIFHKNTFALIQQKLNIGGIYLIGLTWENIVYGNVMILLPESKKIDKPEAIETIVKLGSFALQRKNAEDALRNSEEKYRRIFESYQDVYFRADIDGTIIEVSPSVSKIGGFNPNEIHGQIINNFFTDESLVKNLGKVLLRDGAISDQDIQLIGKDGKIIDASLNARILRNKKGTPIGSEGVIRDISERKKAEDDFHKSEEKFRTLANFTYDWEYWVSSDNAIIYMSPSCKRISGYNVGEFTNDPNLLVKIIHPEDIQNFEKHISKAKESDYYVINIDYRIVTKDQKIKWINHVCQKVYGDDGKYLGIRASNRDITDRKIAEEELRNSEERFRTLFYESPDSVFVEDYDGNVLDANPAACKLHAMEKEELVGKNIMDLIPKSDRDIVAKTFPKWITGEIVNFRGVSKASNGECIPVEIHASKIHYSGKNALLFIVHDITKIKETEDKLKEAVEKAEEADMLKSVFLANMSHEIRTPMNAIIGFSEILSDQDLTKKERAEFINYITQGSNTLMNLIEDIIDITKIEAGQIKINFADCDVNKLMDELYATFLKMKNKIGKPHLELRLNKPIVEEGFFINTDPSRIRQVLSNLIGNALKFTEEGYIEFGFTISSENQIVFYVKDTGIGIPIDKQDMIFERFGQVEGAKESERKGTGLGLSISKKLSELLGGSLSVVSEPEKGSVFYLTLPISKDYEKDILKGRPTTPLPIDWSDKIFLIAEDSVLNYTYLEALFQKTNVKVLWAKDGKEAIEMCRKNASIDLVLMDIKMPVLSGLEAIDEIKKFRKDLPIIVQTAYAMPEDREKSLAAGGDEHLTKPINADELFSTINKFLN